MSRRTQLKAIAKIKRMGRRARRANIRSWMQKGAYDRAVHSAYFPLDKVYGGHDTSRVLYQLKTKKIPRSMLGGWIHAIRGGPATLYRYLRQYGLSDEICPGCGKLKHVSLICRNSGKDAIKSPLNKMIDPYNIERFIIYRNNASNPTGSIMVTDHKNPSRKNIFLSVPGHIFILKQDKEEKLVINFTLVKLQSGYIDHDS